MSDRQHRHPAEWMCMLDERILEHLEREGWSTPDLIEQATTMNASKARARERLQMLTDCGLVAPLFEDSRMYELTSEGQRYLRGELDAKKHLDQPNPHAV